MNMVSESTKLSPHLMHFRGELYRLVRISPCLTRFFHFFRTVLPWYEDKEIFSSMTDRLGKKDGMGRREVWPVADMWLVMSRPIGILG